MSSKLGNHINKNNLHHAYLIEGARDVVLPEIVEILKELGVKTIQNPDFVTIELDTFKVDDARNLKAYAQEKANSGDMKIFIILTNGFLLEAQNTLLKMFEEPIDNTHFFLVVPDTNALLKTFISRFYLIRRGVGVKLELAEQFIKMPLQKRIDFIKEMIAEAKEEEEEEVITLDSTRSKALRFLNALETSLHQSVNKMPSDIFHHIFKVRQYLRMPGSSTKSLMESVALIIPNL